MTTCEVSIIIPSRGKQEDLERILSDLSENESNESWELIIVDDGSETRLDLGASKKENWKIFRTEESQGAARARNLGAKEAKGKHLAFLSLFLSIPEDYVESVKAFISSHEFDYAQHLTERSPSVSATQFQKFVVDQKHRLSNEKGELRIKQSLFTAAIINSDIFQEIGGFDNAMQHYGGHELDLIYRMDKAGYNKRIIIQDLPLQRVRLEDHETLRNRLREYGKTGLPNLLKKHPELKPLILEKPLFWALMFNLGLSRFLENRISKNINTNKQLSRSCYRLYLHLLVRNAWAAR